MSKMLKIYGDKKIYMPEFTGKDFARLILNSAKETSYKFPKGDVIIRLMTVDEYTSKYALLVYPKKSSGDKIKKVLYVPLPENSIKPAGLLIDKLNVAINVLSDEVLHIRLNRACDYLDKKYGKTSNFFYDNTSSPYASNILSYNVKPSKEIVRNNMTLYDFINVWKSTNEETLKLFEIAKNRGVSFSSLANPGIYPGNLSEGIYTDKCEFRDMLKSLTKFKNSLRRRRHEIGDEEYRQVCEKILEITLLIDKAYKKPMICFTRENY